ncbi:MAG: rod shape-determining protein MreD [Clostridiaceae bacterium]|jgi:rod shape-determining protein MreD|nr:rod shape-determining protein MreD [Clostridiaceae bacterium]
MKYRVIAASILILMGAFFQSTVLEHIEILNIRPNLLIVLMVIVSLLRSPVESAAMALLFGLTLDVLMGKTLGWYALLFFLVSIPISLINEKLYRDKILVLLTLTLGSSVFVEFMFFIIVFMFRGYEYLPFIFWTVIIPEAIYNCILILPLFKPVATVYNFLDKIDRRRNRLAA